jgi:hypothetical protein
MNKKVNKKFRKEKEDANHLWNIRTNKSIYTHNNCSKKRRFNPSGKITLLCSSTSKFQAVTKEKQAFCH